MPRRVVMDTNVLIAALRSRTGASARVLREIQQSRIEIQLSVPLHFQYVTLVARQLDELCYSTREVAGILAYLRDVATLHELYFLIRPGLVDPGDDMILELASKSRAEFIVTHNARHFAGAAERYGVTVVRPIQLLEALGAVE